LPIIHSAQVVRYQPNKVKKTNKPYLYTYILIVTHDITSFPILMYHLN
jgi:hypothetical protein